MVYLQPRDEITQQITCIYRVLLPGEDRRHEPEQEGHMLTAKCDIVRHWANPSYLIVQQAIPAT
jgi:hypothetical protein